MSHEREIKLLNAQELMGQVNLQNEIEHRIALRGSKSQYPSNTDEERALIQSHLGERIRFYEKNQRNY